MRKRTNSNTYNLIQDNFSPSTVRVLRVFQCKGSGFFMFLVCFVGLAVVAFRYSDVLDNKPDMQMQFNTNKEIVELNEEPEELAIDHSRESEKETEAQEKREEPNEVRTEEQKVEDNIEIKKVAQKDDDDDEIPVENLAKPKNDGPIREQENYIFLRMADSADVFVVHAGTIKSRRDIPDRRKPSQKILLFMRESPAREWQGFYHLWDKIPMSTFDITMTYLQKSDYWERYYTMDEIKGEDDPRWREEQLDRAVARKVNSSFLLVSHCGALSGRDEVVDELNKYHKVNKFGKCGEPCDLQCEADMIKHSFFYFALENSVCPDYITEKFYRFKKLIVPITFKRSLLTGIVPPDSFIAIDDFCSIEKLGKYLNWLMKNPEEYKKYFNWTRKYRKDYRMSDSICNLCKDLHFNTVPSRNYSDYRTIKSYMPRSSCTSGFGYKMLRPGRCDNFEDSGNPLLKFYTEE